MATTTTTHNDQAVPSMGQGSVANRPAKAAKPRPSRGKTAILAVIALGLVAFNAWWYWRESRPVANAKLIALWMSREQYGLAEPELREQLRRSPNDGESRLTLARLLAARNDLAGCARELHKVPFWYPKKGEALFREGTVHLMLNRAKDAETDWLEVIKDDPLHPQPPDVYHDSFFELMKLYATQDRWDDAFVHLWRAYDLATPEDKFTLVFWRLRAELERVAPAESLPRLQEYVAADPTDLESLRALARAELALGKFDDANQHLLACLKADPSDGLIWRDYLTMLHDRGDRQACFAAVAKIPKEAGAEPEIWKFRAMAREDKGDFAGAAECYGEAIARNPNIVEYHYKLAIIEERLGNREQAANHRKIAKTLREARASLPKAYADYREAADNRANGGPALADSIRNLSEVCRTLGFVRAADAWLEIGRIMVPN